MKITILPVQKEDVKTLLALAQKICQSAQKNAAQPVLLSVNKKNENAQKNMYEKNRLSPSTICLCGHQVVL